jgi:glucose dehydrogenase
MIKAFYAIAGVFFLIMAFILWHHGDIEKSLWCYSMVFLVNGHYKLEEIKEKLKIK